MEWTVIYEDEDLTIESGEDAEPYLRISQFKNGHFVDEVIVNINDISLMKLLEKDNDNEG